MKCRLVIPAICMVFLLPPSTFADCSFTEVQITTTSGNYSEEMSWEIRNAADEIVFSFQPTGNYMQFLNELCLEDGCYILMAYDTYGDGWNGGHLQISFPGEVLDYTLQDGGFGDLAFGVNASGCPSYIEGLLNDQTIVQYLDSGDKNNRINWAIQNRGMNNPNDEFQNPEQFFSMLEDSLLVVFDAAHPLTKTPYANYRNFFNLYGWYWPDAPSVDEGWSWATFKAMRDAYFLPWADEEHGWATLFSVSRTGGGGGAGVQPATRTGDGLMYGMGWETLLHEFGHTMPQVPDEYSASGEWSGGNCWESANTTGRTIRDSIPWRLWIEENTPLPTPYTEAYLDQIGAFEGALTNFFGCHRPTARGCYMGAGGFGVGYGQDLCPPCRQRVICQLYRYVDVIENPVPQATVLSINGSATLTFGADFVKPEPNTQVYSWYLNGELIAQGVEQLDVEFGLCDSYELTLTVEDTTAWVRYDPHYDHIYKRPFASRTWHIDQTAGNQNTPVAEATPEDADCTGLSTGAVSFEVSGGTAPYQAWWQGESVGLLHSGLAPGPYSYWITDTNGCGLQVDAVLGQEPVLDMELCTTFDGTWTVSVQVDGYEPDELNFLWSDGSTGPILEEVGDGNYGLTLTTPSQCMVAEGFTLAAPGPETGLTLTSTAYNPGAGLSNGAIYVEVEGGEPAYTIQWLDRYAQDLTDSDPGQSDASGTAFGHLPEMAFDDDLSTKWLQGGATNLWLSFVFPEGRLISEYTITSGDDEEDRDPKDWYLQGSLNGSNWVNLDERLNEEFATRKQQKFYTLDNTTAFKYYRLFILENSGAPFTQLQEMELIGTDPSEAFLHRPEWDQQWSRVGLTTGDYRFEVKDSRSQCASGAESLHGKPPLLSAELVVVQESACALAIENPVSGQSYLWFADEAGLELLHTGISFQPPSGGNFWVTAVAEDTEVQALNLKGFAVTMPEQPELAETTPGLLEVVNPEAGLEYRWYTEACGGTPIHIGTAFNPGAQSEVFYVSAWWAEPFPEAIEPTVIPSFMLKMDASDLDGDGVLDQPGPPNSSLYSWSFVPDGQWNSGSWFAFRGNHQNGLGIIDFGTIWLQCFNPGISGYKTVLMAYQENELSWKGSAPFYGLDQRIPYSDDPAQALYSSNTPASTLNGTTWLNGALVDPLSTANPLEFCVLGQTFTQGVGWTDCTDTHWEGKLGEILFFEDELNAEEMIGLSEYLRRKWLRTADLESLRTPYEWTGTVAAEAAPIGERLKLYPNPADGQIVVEPGRDFSGRQLVVQIFDLHGRPVKIEERPYAEQLGLDLRGLAPGFYQLVIRQGEVSRTGTFVLR